MRVFDRETPQSRVRQNAADEVEALGPGRYFVSARMRSETPDATLQASVFFFDDGEGQTHSFSRPADGTAWTTVEGVIEVPFRPSTVGIRPNGNPDGPIFLQFSTSTTDPFELKNVRFHKQF